MAFRTPTLLNSIDLQYGQRAEPSRIMNANRSAMVPKRMRCVFDQNGVGIDHCIHSLYSLASFLYAGLARPHLVNLTARSQRFLDHRSCVPADGRLNSRLYDACGALTLADTSKRRSMPEAKRLETAGWKMGTELHFCARRGVCLKH